MSKNHTCVRACTPNTIMGLLGGAHVAGTPDFPTVTTWLLAACSPPEHVPLPPRSSLLCGRLQGAPRGDPFPAVPNVSRVSRLCAARDAGPGLLRQA